MFIPYFPSAVFVLFFLVQYTFIHCLIVSDNKLLSTYFNICVRKKFYDASLPYLEATLPNQTFVMNVSITALLLNFFQFLKLS